MLTPPRGLASVEANVELTRFALTVSDEDHHIDSMVNATRRAIETESTAGPAMNALQFSLHQWHRGWPIPDVEVGYQLALARDGFILDDANTIRARVEGDPSEDEINEQIRKAAPSPKRLRFLRERGW